ncbi:hypothetical protein ACFLXY_03785 [Chloroflexota bacterium]
MTGVCHSREGGNLENHWIPAFAGMDKQNTVLIPLLSLRVSPSIGEPRQSI